MAFYIIVDTLFLFRIILVSETLSCFITWAFKHLGIFNYLQLNKEGNIKHIQLQNCWLIKTLRLSPYMTPLYILRKISTQFFLNFSENIYILTKVKLKKVITSSSIQNVLATTSMSRNEKGIIFPYYYLNLSIWKY